MPSQLFLAATAAEFQTMAENSGNIAWMACHFSPYGTGLSNFPVSLPPGAMLIVNDRTPVCGHDPDRIAGEICRLVADHKCSRVLLDFQRPGEALTQAIAAAVMEAVPCPTAVTAEYARENTWPVLLPPIPLHKTPAQHFAPWQDRPIWLELALDATTYFVTREGCRILPAQKAGEYPHRDDALHCRYRIQLQTDAVEFCLCREPDCLDTLMQDAGMADCFVGLYQELAQSMAHCTARFQSRSRC